MTTDTATQASRVDIADDVAYQLETALRHALMSALRHPIARHNVSAIIESAGSDIRQLNEKVLDEALKVRWSEKGGK